MIRLMLVIFLFSMPDILAGTIDPSVPDAKYIEYGEKFIHTYKICGTYNSGQLFCGSSVAISPNWFITAAHIVKNARTCIVSHNDKAHQIKKIIVHENFDENKFGKFDIALCYVEEDIGLEFYPEFYQEDNEVGKRCSISGYGLTGTFDTGIKQGDTRKRAGSNTIDYSTNHLLICSVSGKGEKTHTELEFLIGSGDSGGGLYIDGKLAGINSCVLAADKNPDSSYGDESGHTRISKFIDWIKENTKR